MPKITWLKKRLNPSPTMGEVQHEPKNTIKKPFLLNDKNIGKILTVGIFTALFFTSLETWLGFLAIILLYFSFKQLQKKN